MGGLCILPAGSGKMGERSRSGGVKRRKAGEEEKRMYDEETRSKIGKSASDGLGQEIRTSSHVTGGP